MSNNRHFDEYIQEQFNHYSPDVHPRIWEKIMEEKNKRKPVGFWVTMLHSRTQLLLIGLVIALSSGGAWLYYQNFLPFKHMISLNNQKENKPAGNHKQKTPADLPVNNNNLLNANETISSTESNYLSSQYVSATNISGKTKIHIVAPQPSWIPDVKNNMYTNHHPTTANEMANTQIQVTSPDLETTSNNTMGGTLLGRLSFEAQKMSVNRISGKEAKLSFNPLLHKPDCPSFEKDAAGNKKYIEFYAGPDYGIRSLQDTANSAYLLKRKETAKFKSGFSAGFRYTRVFNNAMSIRTGVNYSQINEKFTLTQGNIVQVTYIINNNGDTIGSFTTTGTRKKTTINRFRNIDIPLVVGYEIGNGKLHANINAGAIVNIYSWHKGDIVDENGNPVSITTGKNSSPYQFKTNAGIGFIGALSVYYKLTERLHLMAEPYFRYNLSQMSKSEISLKQKYHTAGLRLGLRVDLKQRQQK